jgi:hypothetical protein
MVRAVRFLNYRYIHADIKNKKIGPINLDRIILDGFVHVHAGTSGFPLLYFDTCLPLTSASVPRLLPATLLYVHGVALRVNRAVGVANKSLTVLGTRLVVFCCPSLVWVGVRPNGVLRPLPSVRCI